MRDCRLIVGAEEKPSGIVDLLETLKKIDDTGQSQLEEFKKQNKLDASATKLLTFLEKEKDQFSAKKIFIWDSVDDLRQIYEPRVVVEFDSSDKIKVDICVGFRGAQFVVFNKHNSYDDILYGNICKNYRFYYWQDYQDEIEHYNRYLLANENLDCQDGNGPILPNYDDLKCSAGEEDSILIKYDKEEVDFHEEILEKLVEIQENLVIR